MSKISLFTCEVVHHPVRACVCENCVALHSNLVTNGHRKRARYPPTSDLFWPLPWSSSWPPTEWSCFNKRVSEKCERKSPRLGFWSRGTWSFVLADWNSPWSLYTPIIKQSQIAKETIWSGMIINMHHTFRTKQHTGKYWAFQGKSKTKPLLITN